MDPICGTCGVWFPLQEEYVAHKRSGCGIKVEAAPPPYQSQPRQPYKVKSKPILQYQDFQINYQMAYCEICRKELSSVGYKKIHMKNVHGDDRCEKVEPVAKGPQLDMKDKLLGKFKESLSDSQYSFLLGGKAWMKHYSRGLSPELVFDRMVEKAKMGDKSDLERAVCHFLKTFKSDRKSKSRKRKSAYLLPATRNSYWSQLRKGIREYTDGLVDLEMNPNDPIASNPNFEDQQKSPDSGIDIDVVTIDQDHDEAQSADLSEVDFPTKCPHCPPSVEDIFLTEPALEAHCRTMHGYKCPTCFRMAGKKSDMVSHFEKEHGSRKPYFCGNCTTVFLSFHDSAAHNCKRTDLQGAASLLESLLLKVKAWSPSLCPFCPESQNLYQTPSSYESHCLTSHPGQCPVCPESFRYLGCKRNHFRSSHSNLYPNYCNSCPAVYLNRELMESEHKCSSTPMVLSEQPPWWDDCLYTCKTCGEGFPETNDVRDDT